jgi:hypothetical protein
MIPRFHLLCSLVLAALIGACQIHSALADGTQAASPTSWELTPYRVEICVIVEPSARLTPALEAVLREQLIAQVEAAFGGPWQVSASAPVTKLRGQLIRQLSLRDVSPEMKAKPDTDKLLVIGVQEKTDGFQVTARELDVASNRWNLPALRTAAQASRLSAESFAALQAAWGPLLRIDSVDKETVTVTLRGGALPKRDGAFLTVDRNTTFGLYSLQTDKAGKPVPGSVTEIIWTFLTPLGTPGSGPPGSRATFKCRLFTALDGAPLPNYHPLQPRLACGYARSDAGTKLVLVDKESPQPPLEGYEVFLAPIDGSSAATKPERIGVTNRNGELAIPAGDGTLRHLVISHGGEELFRRPFLPGLRAEARLSLPSDRRRLELAAEIAAAEDELFDMVGRLTIFGARASDAIARRDVAAVNRVTAELKSAGTLTSLTGRVAALESHLASADEATRRRLEPAVAQIKAQVEALKAQASKLGL